MADRFSESFLLITMLYSFRQWEAFTDFWLVKQLVASSVVQGSFPRGRD